jgi:hypothetical protein
MLNGWLVKVLMDKDYWREYQFKGNVGGKVKV